MNKIGPLIINVDGIVLSKDEAKLLEHDLIGSVILFSHNHKNIKQLSKLIKDIKNIKENILISVDHEGGRVQRFREGFTRLPSFEEIGSLYASDKKFSVLLAYACGFVSGYELAKVGVDINFSPVVDINRNLFKNTQHVLKDRCFGKNVETILELAKAYINGSICGGVVPVLKHYPGHGAIDGDTHIDYCSSNLEKDKLKEDLLPFFTLNEHSSGEIPIMTSHIKFPNVDKEIVSYSKRWLSDIPYEEIGKTILFISDDLEMKAAITEKNITAAQRVINSLLSGCDMVIATTMLKSNVIASKKSYEYFNEYYLTQELIDFYKDICNAQDRAFVERTLYSTRNKVALSGFPSSYEENSDLVKNYNEQNY